MGAVASLLDELDLPRRLTDVGVDSGHFPLIAERALGNSVVRANPRPIETKAHVEEILALAA